MIVDMWRQRGKAGGQRVELGFVLERRTTVASVGRESGSAASEGLSRAERASVNRRKEKICTRVAEPWW